MLAVDNMDHAVLKYMSANPRDHRDMRTIVSQSLNANKEFRKARAEVKKKMGVN